MKIAYIIDIDIIESNSSVLRKITSAINCWDELGNEVHLLIVSFKSQTEFLPQVKNLRVFERRELSILKISSIQTYLGRNIAFGQVFNYLSTFHPDLIYYRPNVIWYPNNTRCIKVAPTVLEMNTLDEDEVKLVYGRNSIKYFIYRYGRKRILKYSKGIIAVTNEIAKSFDSFKYPIKVIANGYGMAKAIVHKSMRTIENSRAQVIFIGTPNQAWQGFEKFAQMAKLIPEADFHLIGPNRTDNDDCSNLKVYGYLNSKEIEEIYKIADIGVGTLALYKKNMNEACPLKVREYVAHGLPVIIGYLDTDLSDQPFVLNIDNSENSVIENIDRIREFIKEWKSRSIDVALVAPLIDSVKKEKERMLLFTELTF